MATDKNRSLDSLLDDEVDFDEVTEDFDGEDFDDEDNYKDPGVSRSSERYVPKELPRSNMSLALNSEVSLSEAASEALTNMVARMVETQTKFIPMYEKMAFEAINILQNEDEYKNMEIKDILKVLELSVKLSNQPIEQLAKLVQTLTQLQEKSELSRRMNNVEDLVKELEEAKAATRKEKEDEVEVVEPEPEIVEE